MQNIQLYFLKMNIQINIKIWVNMKVNYLIIYLTMKNNKKYNLFLIEDKMVKI